jgi:hypothetical protein
MTARRLGWLWVGGAIFMAGLLRGVGQGTHRQSRTAEAAQWYALTIAHFKPKMIRTIPHSFWHATCKRLRIPSVVTP